MRHPPPTHPLEPWALNKLPCGVLLLSCHLSPSTAGKQLFSASRQKDVGFGLGSALVSSRAPGHTGVGCPLSASCRLPSLQDSCGPKAQDPKAWASVGRSCPLPLLRPGLVPGCGKGKVQLDVALDLHRPRLGSRPPFRAPGKAAPPRPRAAPGSASHVAGRAESGCGDMAAEQDPEARAAARPLLTDLYQATMALGYWRAGRACDEAEFELFFRRCPFGGAFALAAGLRDCVRFLRSFRLQDAGSPRPREPSPPGAPGQGPPARRGPPFPPLWGGFPGFPRAPPLDPAHQGLCRPPDVQFLASVLPADTDPAFFEHLRALDCSGVTVRALPEGSLAFPGVSGAEWVEGRPVGPGGAELTALPAGAPAAGVGTPAGCAAAGDTAAVPGRLCQVGQRPGCPGVGLPAPVWRIVQQRQASDPEPRFLSVPQPHCHECSTSSPDCRTGEAAAGDGAATRSGSRRGSHSLHLQLPGW